MQERKTISKAAKTCFLLFFILCLMILLWNIFGTNPGFKHKTPSEEMTLANNIDTVSRIRETVWPSLSSEERLETLQTIANIEAHYLGLPYILTVRVSRLESPVLAQYDDKTYTIRLDSDHFETDPARNVVDSVCHEACHAYQICLCKLYDSLDSCYQNLLLFDDVTRYHEEFSSYADGTDSAEDNYWQKCEQDARSYAGRAVKEYYSAIEWKERKDDPE